MKKVHLFILFTFAFSAMTQAQISSELLRKANNGDADAMNWIGYDYMQGDRVQQNYVTAMEWFQKAAEKGNASAMIWVGLLFFNGQGVAQDYSKAMEWFRKAAANGNTGKLHTVEQGETLYGLAKRYGVTMDELISANPGSDKGIKKGQELVIPCDGTSAYAIIDAPQQVQEAGWAMFNIGNLYFDAKGVTQDYDKAMEWYQKAADIDYLPAIHNVGYLYYHGYGVPQDYKKAFQYFSRASERGYALSKGKLGEMYYNGYYVEQDYDKAFELLKKAAEATDGSNGDAMKRLSDCYRFGKGTTKDLEKAEYWLKKAQDNGSKDANKIIRLISDRWL